MFYDLFLRNIKKIIYKNSTFLQRKNKNINKKPTHFSSLFVNHLLNFYITLTLILMWTLVGNHWRIMESSKFFHDWLALSCSNIMCELRRRFFLFFFLFVCIMYCVRVCGVKERLFVWWIIYGFGYYLT